METKRFNYATMRQTLIGKFKSYKNIEPSTPMTSDQKVEFATNLVLCIRVFIKVGNSISKVHRAVVQRRASRSHIQKLYNAFNMFEVNERTPNPEGVTLAKIASCSIPLLYLASIVCNTEKRFNVECDAYLQNPVFRGVPGICNTEGYKKFIAEWYVMNTRRPKNRSQNDQGAGIVFSDPVFKASNAEGDEKSIPLRDDKMMKVREAKRRSGKAEVNWDDVARLRFEADRTQVTVMERILAGNQPISKIQATQMLKSVIFDLYFPK